MATIARPTKTASGTINYAASSLIKSSEVNSDLNTIYTDYNGNITNANISASAAIAASKLNLSTIVSNVDITGTLDVTGDTTIVGSLTTDTLTTDTLSMDNGASGQTNVTQILDEDDMVSDSATALATQQSIKAYVDSTNAGHTWTDYSATSTVTGWTSFSVKKIDILEVGELVIVDFYIQGTSNATAASFTVSSASNSAVATQCPINSRNNGGTATTGTAIISSASSTVNLYSTANDAAWTASGDKRIIGQIIYKKA